MGHIQARSSREGVDAAGALSGPGRPRVRSVVAAVCFGVALATPNPYSAPVAKAAAGTQPKSAEVQARELQTLRARIRELQGRLNQTVGARDTERQHVRALDQKIAELVRDLHVIEGQLTEREQRLRLLERRRLTLHTAIAKQGKELEREVRAAYMLGRQPYLKLLLNQEHPERISRVLGYYRYLNGARLREIERARSALEELRAVEQEIDAQRQRLLELRDAQVRRTRAREEVRAQRRQALALLERKVHDQTAEITRLREDERQLQGLIEQLQHYLEDIPLTADARFRETKGRLPLPTTGRVRIRYGEPRAGGAMRSKGVFLGAAEGQDVISVARGRVAFADWLRGFGLLLILEHGDGYMTLYGHNQSLYAQVGDWVEAGQVIAAVGSTGDTPESGVYFEIRQQGQPRDPLQWCRLP